MALLLDAAMTGAEVRSLRVLDALYRGEPSVIFGHQLVSLDEVLDVAQAMQAPFISVDVTTFDFPEFLTEDNNEVPRTSLPPQIKALQKHQGEIDGLFIRWIVGGSLFLYMSEPDWSAEASDLRDAWEEKVDESRQQDVQARWARRSELAAELEALPALRQVGSRGRKALATNLVQTLLQDTDDMDVIVDAVREAVEQTGVNSQSQYGEIEADLSAVAAELIETARWKAKRRTPERLAATKHFLMERTGGYAPTAALATLVRNTAEDMANGAAIRLGSRT